MKKFAAGEENAKDTFKKDGNSKKNKRAELLAMKAKIDAARENDDELDLDPYVNELSSFCHDNPVKMNATAFHKGGTRLSRKVTEVIPQDTASFAYHFQLSHNAASFGEAPYLAFRNWYDGHDFDYDKMVASVKTLVNTYPALGGRLSNWPRHGEQRHGKVGMKDAACSCFKQLEAVVHEAKGIHPLGKLKCVIDLNAPGAWVIQANVEVEEEENVAHPAGSPQKQNEWYNLYKELYAKDLNKPFSGAWNELKKVKGLKAFAEITEAELKKQKSKGAARVAPARAAPQAANLARVERANMAAESANITEGESILSDSPTVAGSVESVGTSSSSGSELSGIDAGYDALQETIEADRESGKDTADLTWIKRRGSFMAEGNNEGKVPSVHASKRYCGDAAMIPTSSGSAINSSSVPLMLVSMAHVTIKDKKTGEKEQVTAITVYLNRCIADSRTYFSVLNSLDRLYKGEISNPAELHSMTMYGPFGVLDEHGEVMTVGEVTNFTHLPVPVGAETMDGLPNDLEAWQLEGLPGADTRPATNFQHPVDTFLFGRVQQMDMMSMKLRKMHHLKTLDLNKKQVLALVPAEALGMLKGAANSYSTNDAIFEFMASGTPLNGFVCFKDIRGHPIPDPDWSTVPADCMDPACVVVSSTLPHDAKGRLSHAHIRKALTDEKEEWNYKMVSMVGDTYWLHDNFMKFQYHPTFGKPRCRQTTAVGTKMLIYWNGSAVWRATPDGSWYYVAFAGNAHHVPQITRKLQLIGGRVVADEVNEMMNFIPGSGMVAGGLGAGVGALKGVGGLGTGALKGAGGVGVGALKSATGQKEKKKKNK